MPAETHTYEDSAFLFPVDSLQAADSIAAASDSASRAAFPADSAPAAVAEAPAGPDMTVFPDMTEQNHGLDLPGQILVAITAVLTILLSRKFISVIPASINCLFKWKECIRMEFNIRSARDRNVVYSVLIIPACLMLDRYSVRFPSFMSGLHPALHLLCTGLVFFAFVWLRNLTKPMCKRVDMDRLCCSASFLLFRTMFCVAIPFCLATLGILNLADVSENVIKTVIFYEIVLFYALFLLRKIEILRHYRSLLSTILYLCALEFMPVVFLAILWIV